ncbi:potassium channel protein [candidate division BRC1 bacterium HGW-BRC1-1]|nr:MAG: potassium channel protein [candidate division BRC1 bacterium HGW-BRC1-1]
MLSAIRRNSHLIVLTLLVLLGGTAGYMLIEGMSLLDAFYMTCTTITTVGYREIVDPSSAGKIFTIVLIFLGLGTIFLVLIDIGQEFITALAMRRVRMMEHHVAALKDHYILCGHGRMGRVVADHLRQAGAVFVVVDNSEDMVGQIKESGCHTVLGDATMDETLERAGVRNARGLVSVLSKDADNVFVTLTARELNPAIFILTRANNDDAISKLYRAGASKVLNPYESAGARIAQTLLRPVVGDFMELFSTEEGVSISMEEVHVMAGSRLAGKSLRESDIRAHTSAVIVAIKKSGAAKLKINPTADEVVEVDDMLVAIADTEGLNALADLARE